MLRYLRVVAICCLALACGEKLDRYSEVKDLRVLAIRAEPPELQLVASEVLVYPFEADDDPALDQEVRFEALVLDPRGGTVTYNWEWCPVESGRSCRDYEAQRDVAPKLDLGAGVIFPTADLLDDSHLILPDADASLQPVDDAQRQAHEGVPYAIDDFIVSRQRLAPLGVYFAATTFFGFGLGSWPSAVLTVKSHGDELVSQKRIVLGVQNLGDFNDKFRDALGFVFCNGELEQGEEDTCISVPTLTPNHNPDLIEISKADGDLATAEFTSLAGNRLVGLQAGESMRLRPEFSDDSIETYYQLEGDLQTRTVLISEVQEVITVSWFVTFGDVQDSLTTEQYTKTLDTVYTAPLDIPPGGYATVWMVARDQRGGVDWDHVDVRIEPRDTLLTDLEDTACAGPCD